MPALHDLVTITGTLATFKMKIELHPTAAMTTMANAPLPPIATVNPTDVSPTGSSNLRGTLVKLTTQLTVDNVTPAQLYYSACSMGDGGMVDGGMPLCSGCRPPTYSGFQVNDGAGHELLIENTFYTSEHLEGSPECLTTAGVIPVTVGKTFSQMTGILDWDSFGSVQAVSPVTDTDYVTP